MRSLIAVVLLFSMNLVFAESIIIDSLKVESLAKKLEHNKSFYKVGPIKFKIDKEQIGKAQTPFYQSGLLAKRFYKNGKNCFELTILESKNIARKVKCYDKVADLRLSGFEDFKAVQVKDLIAVGLGSFRATELSQSFELLAFVQPYDMYIMDLSIFGAKADQLAPKQKFKVHLNAISDLVLKGEKLELRQKLKLSVEEIGILSGKTVEFINTIKPISGGLIFSNARGQILIYNPTLPSPFGDYELSFNSELSDHLKNWSKQSLYAPVCFRDNYASVRSQDCHQLIFEGQSIAQLKKIKILFVDFLNQKINFL